MTYLDSISEKRQRAAQHADTQGSRAAVLNKLSAIERATMSKKGAGMSARREKIIEAINEVLEQDDSVLISQNHKELLEAVNTLKDAISEVTTSGQEQTKSLQQTFEDVLEAISTSQSQVIEEQTQTLQRLVDFLKHPPKIPVPSVTVNERELDLKPIQKAIKDAMKPMTRRFSLSDYRAHDLNNSPDNMQYIGFQDEDGEWYIMQHDPENNRDRFYFGNDGYDIAWDERITHDYKNLSEARRALRT